MNMMMAIEMIGLATCEFDKSINLCFPFQIDFVNITINAMKIGVTFSKTPIPVSKALSSS